MLRNAFQFFFRSKSIQKRTLNAGNDQKHKINKKQKQTFAKQIPKRVPILKKNPKIVVLKVIAIAVAAATAANEMYQKQYRIFFDVNDFD